LSLTVSEGEGRHAWRNLHLHVDRAHLDALKSDCGDALDHLGLTPAFSGLKPFRAKPNRRKSYNRRIARTARFTSALRNHNG
jgi:hypothetical protein